MDVVIVLGNVRVEYGLWEVAEEMVYFGWREAPSQYFVQFLGDACCGFVEGDGRSTNPFDGLVGCVKSCPKVL